MGKRYLLRLLLPWCYFTGVLALVEILVRAFQVPEYLAPRPSAVFLEIVQSFSIIMPHLYVTLAEALIGFAVGNSFALLFGALFSQSRVIQKGIYPVIVGLQAVPILAIAPFILIWFGPGLIGKAVMAALICYFPATVISTDGLSRVNRDALALFDSLGASRSTIFWSLRLPAAFPAIISSLQVSATLCIVGAIVAELSGASKGVGYLIIRASYEFRTTMLFAVLTLVSLVTYGFFYLIQTLGRRLSRRFTFNYTSSVE